VRRSGHEPPPARPPARPRDFVSRARHCRISAVGRFTTACRCCLGHQLVARLHCFRCIIEPVDSARNSLRFNGESARLLRVSKTYNLRADLPQVVGPLVDGVGKLGGLLEDPSAVEQLVRAVESSLTDRGVIGEVLSQMPTLYISFVNMPGGGPEAKRLEFVAGELRCVGDFALGQKGVLTQDQIETFFELKFFAKERDLVGKCMASTIPEAVTRLKQVTKSRTFRLMFDLPRLLGGVTVPSKRLDTARLLVSQTGLSRKFDAASKMVARPPPPSPPPLSLPHHWGVLTFCFPSLALFHFTD
jgi:hypothetical protein